MLKTPAEIDLSGQRYRIGQLDAFKQFHLVRRLGPALAAMGVSMSEMMSLGKSVKDSDTDLLSVISPVMDIVAKMSDEDVEYIIRTALTVVQRAQEGGKWAKVQQGNNLMFQDLGMTELIRLTVEVVKENMGDFFSAPPGAPE